MADSADESCRRRHGRSAKMRLWRLAAKTRTTESGLGRLAAIAGRSARTGSVSVDRKCGLSGETMRRFRGLAGAGSEIKFNKNNGLKTGGEGGKHALTS